MQDKLQQLTKNVEFELSDGSVFSLEYNDEFVAKVRKYCELQQHEDITENHLKSFFAAALAAI